MNDEMIIIHQARSEAHSNSAFEIWFTSEYAEVVGALEALGGGLALEWLQFGAGYLSGNELPEGEPFTLLHPALRRKSSRNRSRGRLRRRMN